MQDIEYANIDKLQQEHFWYRANNELVIKWLPKNKSYLVIITWPKIMHNFITELVQYLYRSCTKLVNNHYLSYFDHMPTIHFSITDELAERIAKVMHRYGFTTRSEFFRFMTMWYLESHERMVSGKELDASPMEHLLDLWSARPQPRYSATECD